MTRKVDLYLASLARFGATGVVLEGEASVTFRFATGERHANQTTPNELVMALVQEIATPDAARLLIPLLRDEHQHVRETVILALGHARDPAAVEPLIQMLRTTQDPWEPTHIARALGEIGDPRAIPALQGCLNHKDSAIRREAGEAIRSIQAKANPPREESR